MSCRLGVPEPRVRRISVMTRVRVSLVFIPAVLICSAFAAPTDVFIIVELIAPLIGKDLLAITDLLILEWFLWMMLLMGIPVLGWISIRLLISILSAGMLVLILL